MTSPDNDVRFSSTAIDHDIPPPCPIGSAAPSDYLDDFLIEMNLLDPDDPDIASFDFSELEDLLDGSIEDFDEAPSTTVDENLPDLSEQTTLPSVDQPITNECQATEVTGDDSMVTKISDFNAHSHFVNSTQLRITGQSLKLLTSPFPYQRARYEKELDEVLRYIATPNDNGIELEIPNPRSYMLANESMIMRISRTTTADGAERTVSCHPYSLWIRDKHAKVHDGSILLSIPDPTTENEPIKYRIDNLIMARSKQNVLKNITKWPIFTGNQLDCLGFYSIDTSKPKDIIEQYNLRYSVLRFQIFFVDESQTAHPTDLICETAPIFEYEDQDRKNIPAIFRTGQKRATKRLQAKSNTTPKKNARKNVKQVKTKGLKGPIRQTNVRHIS